MNHLGYFFNEALASMRRGGALTLAAMLSLTLAGLAGGGYVLLKRNSAHWISQAESRFEAVVYFRDGLDEARAKSLGEQLRALPEVAEARLVSPAEAAKELSKDKAVADYFGALGGDNPLPWSAQLRLRTENVGALSAFASKARALEGVSEVDWGQEAAEALLRWLKLLRRSLGVLGVALGLAALLVTASVVRLTVHARREEIGIMRLVGAEPYFIRVPFMLEGLLQGAFGGLLAAGLLKGMGLLMARQALAEMQIDLGAFLPYGVSPLFAAALTGLACALGLLASALALGPALREER